LVEEIIKLKLHKKNMLPITDKFHGIQQSDYAKVQQEKYTCP
jgi:hypothetical protein